MCNTCRQIGMINYTSCLQVAHPLNKQILGGPRIVVLQCILFNEQKRDYGLIWNRFKENNKFCIVSIIYNQGLKCFYSYMLMVLHKDIQTQIFLKQCQKAYVLVSISCHKILGKVSFFNFLFPGSLESLLYTYTKL